MLLRDRFGAERGQHSTMPYPEGRRVEVATMRIGKTIGGKLYWGFGGILVVVAVLSAANLVALFYEQGTKETFKRGIEMSRQTSDVEQGDLNTRLQLRNYL